MYPADAMYFAFEGFCKEHGMDGEGHDRHAARLRAASPPAPTRRCGTSPSWRTSARPRRSSWTRRWRRSSRSCATQSDCGDWVDKFQSFLAVYGNRVVAAHLDVTSPTWLEDPTPVLDTIRGYFERIDQGWDFDAEKQKIADKRVAAIADFESQAGH